MRAGFAHVAVFGIRQSSLASVKVARSLHTISGERLVGEVGDRRHASQRGP